MNIFNNLLYIFLGFFTNYLNYVGIKFTAKQFLKTRQQSIIAVSLPVRLIVFGIIFYFLTKGSFKKAVLFVFGVSLSVILFMINKIISRRRNENING